MHLYLSSTGKVYKRAVGSTVVVEVPLPSGVVVRATPKRPSAVVLPALGKVIMAGPWNRPLVWMMRRNVLWQAGIAKPTSAPTLTATTGSVTGSARGRFTFAEILADGTVVHESSGGPISSVLALSAQGRAWGALPTTHANPRVTHKRLYVSMDGNEFLFVANVALAASTYTETVATNELDPLNAIVNTRGEPPEDTCFVTEFNRRVFYANDESDALNYSDIDEPESVGVTSELKTRDARKVTSIRGMTNELVVGTRKSIQQVQGFGISDFTITMVTQDIGIISHHGSKVINDKLWFPSQDGYYRYASGGFQFLMPNLRTYFRAAYEANPEAYEDLVAAVDRRKHVLVALVPGESGVRLPFAYVGHYLNAETSLGGNGELPAWTFDTYPEYIRTVSEMTDGDLLDRLYSGSCDGFVRMEGVDNTNDDGTSTPWYIIHKHMYMGAQDGDDQHAKTAEYIDLFLSSPNAAVTASIFAGDDGAATAASAQWARTIAASAETKGNRTGVPKTGHRRQVIDCSGHGFSVKVGGTGTSGEYRGFALEWRNEGEQTRGSV